MCFFKIFSLSLITSILFTGCNVIPEGQYKFVSEDFDEDKVTYITNVTPFMLNVDLYDLNSKSSMKYIDVMYKINNKRFILKSARRKYTMHLEPGGQIVTFQYNALKDGVETPRHITIKFNALEKHKYYTVIYLDVRSRQKNTYSFNVRPVVYDLTNKKQIPFKIASDEWAN